MGHAQYNCKVIYILLFKCQQNYSPEINPEQQKTGALTYKG